MRLHFSNLIARFATCVATIKNTFQLEFKTHLSNRYIFIRHTTLKYIIYLLKLLNVNEQAFLLASLARMLIGTSAFISQGFYFCPTKPTCRVEALKVNRQDLEINFLSAFRGFKPVKDTCYNHAAEGCCLLAAS